MRKTAAALLGIFIAFTIVSLFDVLAASLFTMPDIESADRTVLAAAIAAIPLSAKAIIASSWLLAPLGGAWAALRIADWGPGGWIVTAVFLAANVANQAMLPHPLWMQVAAVVLPLAGGWLGQRLHRKPYPGEALLG